MVKREVRPRGSGALSSSHPRVPVETPPSALSGAQVLCAQTTVSKVTGKVPALSVEIESREDVVGVKRKAT